MTRRNLKREALVLALFGAGLLSLAPTAYGKPVATPVAADLQFTREPIPSLSIDSEGHVSSTKNGVKFDVFFDAGRKSDAVVYAINTGRKQLVLTPDKHKAILEDLVKREFTVIVADFKDKMLPGIELERYVIQLVEDARAAADGKLLPSSLIRPQLFKDATGTESKSDTFANNYFVLMPGFTVQRDVAWFRYADIPEAFRKEIARQLGKPFNAADGEKTNTYDIIYPAYGPAVGLLTNYCSDEKGREDYYPTEKTYLVSAFAFKNLAVIHQQYFNDPVGGYPKGYGYYGDQFAAAFIRHVKGNAAKYHIDPRKICAFGHSKGSEVPGMLVNKLRGAAPYFYSKVNYKKLNLTEPEKTIASPFSDLPTDIACAVLGAGIANHEMQSDKMLPWNNNPAKNISPFFLYADHRADTRLNTQNVVAKAQANGLVFETAQLDAHTWPIGNAYDRTSAFVDNILDLHY